MGGLQLMKFKPDLILSFKYHTRASKHSRELVDTYDELGELSVVARECCPIQTPSYLRRSLQGYHVHAIQSFFSRFWKTVGTANSLCYAFHFLKRRERIYMLNKCWTNFILSSTTFLSFIHPKICRILVEGPCIKIAKQHYFNSGSSEFKKIIIFKSVRIVSCKPSVKNFYAGRRRSHKYERTS
jgi:hypothetical protein